MPRQFRLGDDPLTHLIHVQVRPEIRLLLEHEHFTGVVKLVYSGIDTMAFLGLPTDSRFVKGTDFQAWCDRHLKFPCVERILGIEWWSARCAMLHSHTVESHLTDDGRCRKIGYMSEAVPEIVFDRSQHPDLVLVSVPALVRAFFEGTDGFLESLFSDPNRARVAESRLQDFVMHMRNEP